MLLHAVPRDVSRRGLRTALAASALALLAPAPAPATPYDLIPVGDPLYEEARLLETSGSPRLGPLPLLTRPWQAGELARALGRAADSVAGDPALLRLARALQRDRFAPGGGPPSTPRLLQVADGDPEQRLEVSVGLEGRATAEDDTSYFTPGAGFHARIGAALGGWSAHADLVAAHAPQSRGLTDPLFAGNDNFILQTEESYLQYTAQNGGWQWTVGAGRNHFAWGPGAEGSLLFSAQAPPISALWMAASLAAWRLHAASLTGSVGASTGQQLAAHRLEWEPRPGLRLGVAEAVRYRSQGAQPLYLVGVIPYTLVQRILIQEEPDSSAALRNNVMGGVDASWRVLPGTRLYGELLLDDLHLRSGRTPNKIAYQVGWEGVGRLRGSRLAWGGEWTRISRFVYTSHFGSAWVAQRRPLGFATGPDARRVRLWAAWEAARDWQARIAAARTDKGENDLDEAFEPGSPEVNSQTFEGRVERTRELEAALRCWPASGVDLTLLGGYRWVDDAGHVAGRRSRDPFAALAVRVYR